LPLCGHEGSIMAAFHGAVAPTAASSDKDKQAPFPPSQPVQDFMPQAQTLLARRRHQSRPLGKCSGHLQSTSIGQGRRLAPSPTSLNDRRRRPRPSIEQAHRIEGREGREFRHKRSLGHPRLGIDFQNHELPRSAGRVVIPEIRPAHATTAERLMRHEGQLLNILVNISFKICRKT